MSARQSAMGPPTQAGRVARYLPDASPTLAPRVPGAAASPKDAKQHIVEIIEISDDDEPAEPPKPAATAPASVFAVSDRRKCVAHGLGGVAKKSAAQSVSSDSSDSLSHDESEGSAPARRDPVGRAQARSDPGNRFAFSSSSQESEDSSSFSDAEVAAVEGYGNKRKRRRLRRAGAVKKARVLTDDSSKAASSASEHGSESEQASSQDSSSDNDASESEVSASESNMLEEEPLDEPGLGETKPVPKVKNKPHKTPLDPAYIAGFMDGDGSVYISGDTARLNFTQCDPHVLIRIQEEYGGRIHVRRMPDNGPKRSQYSLGLSGWDAHALCLVMLPHLRVKAHVVTLFIRFFDFYRLPDTPEKQALAKAVKEENGRNTRSAIAPLPAISHAYLAGIIDAEGCMRKETIKISQKSDPVLLRDIHATYGGRTRDVCVEFYRQDQRRSILDAVKPHLIVKRDQAEVSLRILDGNTDPALVKKLAELKRVRHELSDADIKALNAAQKDGRTRAIRNDPSNTARLAANQAAARRQAEKGPVNGGVRTEEAMRKAMKTTYSRGKTRRKITDDQIDEVRERLAENPNMRRVAKTMGLHVAQVSDIRDGKLLKLKDLQAAKDPVALNAAAKAAARPRKRTDTSVLMTRASRILGGNNNRDLSDEQILQVRTELSRPGAQQKIIAQQLGISAGLVGKVRQGELQTADEVRAEMRQNGIPVDPCFAIKADGTVTEYNDPWDAAKVLGVPNKKVIKALMEGEGTPFKDRLWYSSREAMETEEATKAQAAMFQVFQVDTKRGNKRVIARFQSYSEAAKAAGIQMASVSSAARLNYETPAGMRWFNSRARAEAFVGEIEMHLFLELV